MASREDFNSAIDFVCAVGNYAQSLDNLVRLKKQVEECAALKCGNCDNWMKSMLCPLEKNVNGRNMGPSTENHACAKFVFGNDKWLQKHTAALNDALRIHNDKYGKTKEADNAGK